MTEMRRVAATIALLVLAVPAVAGVAAWSGCAMPQPQRCCCPGDSAGQDCGCGCGAGRTPARAPEPVAPAPQAPEQGLVSLSAAEIGSAAGADRPLTATHAPGFVIPAAYLVVATCTFRC